MLLPLAKPPPTNVARDSNLEGCQWMDDRSIEEESIERRWVAEEEERAGVIGDAQIVGE